MKWGREMGSEKVKWGQRTIVSNISKNCSLTPFFRFYRQLMERWASALFQTDDYIMMVLSGNVKQRVAHLICWLSEITDDEHKSRVVLLKGEDIAAMLDITPESVSRILADLKRQGILRHRDDGRFEYSEKALKEYAEAAPA